MRAYGVHRDDQGCCPGHDTFPRETYNNRRSKHAQTRDTKVAHRRARRTTRNELKNEIAHSFTDA
jgi:hypothetical protein